MHIETEKTRIGQGDDSALWQRASELAEELKEDMISFAQHLIRCPSLSGQEGKVAALLVEELRKLGYDEVFTDAWGNVVGVVNGSQPGPSILYNGHMDHVDIGDPSEWGGYDPYGGIIDRCKILAEDGKKEEETLVLHGRAASDTKGGLACQVYSGAILARLKREGYPVKGTYLFSAVVMEEPAEQIGMIGLYEHSLPEHGYPVSGVVSCEATGLKLYLGHRGRVELQVCVDGVTSHGSAPWLGINAVTQAMKLIKAVEERYAPELALKDEKLGRASIALTNITCSPGAMCIVPDRCQITYDRRIVPQETPERALEEMQELIHLLELQDSTFHASVQIAATPRTTYTGRTETIPNIKEGWRIPEDHPFVRACAAGLSAVGEPVSYGYWDFGTDLAMVCGKHRVAAVGYSPMQELYCHRSVDRVRLDFMERALLGNLAIFHELTKLTAEDFLLERRGPEDGKEN